MTENQAPVIGGLKELKIEPTNTGIKPKTTKSDLVYNKNRAVMHINVRKSFDMLNTHMSNRLGLQIEIVECIKTEYEIINELISIYKYKNRLPVQTLESDSDVGYEAVKNFIINSDASDFEPPLIREGGSKLANRAPYEPLYTIPNYPSVDPRRTGRVLRIGPRAQINPTILNFLVHNAGDYGFLHYGPYDPTIWYYRGDIAPYVYKPKEVVSYLNSELSFLLR